MIPKTRFVLSSISLTFRLQLVTRGLPRAVFYVAGTRTSSELVTFPVEGVDGGSVSMLAVKVG
jgi:hypothetical protein